MKKQAISLMLAFLILIGIIPMSIPTVSSAFDTNIAYPVEGGNIYFDKDTGTITGCDDTVTSADIPSEIEGSEVLRIGYRAFARRMSLTDVVLPNSVIRIGEYAFESCENLTSIIIGDSVTEIAWEAFCGCGSLSSIAIPDSVNAIYAFAFSGCSSLDSITIGDSVTSIGDCAFYATPFYLDESNWVEDVLYLNNYLIKAKASLNGEYAISEGTSLIADYAFDGCKDLTGVLIPDSVDCIGQSAFANCSSLTDVNIPEGLHCIEYSAFEGCSSLISIVIPESVTSIDSYAFRGCSNLVSIHIPDSVMNIGSSAFYDTALYLDESNWTDDVLYIGNHLIEAKTSLSGEYVIRDGVLTIAESAFRSCWEMTGLVIPNSVANIGAYAFCNTGLVNVTIPDGVTCINSFLFWTCSSLTNVNIPDSVTTIEGAAFQKCSSLISIDIPNGVSAIENYTFDGCDSLTEVTIPDSVSRIGCYAFWTCDSLSSITIPDSVDVIDDEAFAHCSNLNSVYFLGNAPVLGSNVFDNYVYCSEIENWDYRPIEGLTLYYVEGRQGWTSPKWNGYPTATWIPPIEFADVAYDAWYEDAVEYAVDNGLMNGMSATTFEPETTMSRAMLVTVLWRYAGEPKEGTNRFTDVPAGQWYTEAVAWAAHNGIVGGVGNNKFDPNGNITREQMAAILYRYCNNLGIDTQKRADLASFPDGYKVSTWAYDALSWANAEGLINGTQSGSNVYLDPQGNATRAQVATILMRFIENVVK